MKLRSNSVAPLCLLIAGLTLCPAPAALAQHETGPSNYLYLTNVQLKPNVGAAYTKIESDEVEALRAAGAPSRYLGLSAITGTTNVLYLHGFDSFADLQKGHDETMANSKLEDTLMADSAAEAPLVAERHTSIYTYEKDLSLNPNVDLSKMRFMRILLFHVRSGQDQDFKHLIKVLIKAYQSSVPDAKWAMFEKLYGVGSDNTYILVTPMETLSTVDVMHDSGKTFRDSVGEDQLDLIRRGISAEVESSESDLYAFGPRISYAPDAWVISAPDFWGEK
jgi:hypothetical protein